MPHPLPQNQWRRRLALAGFLLGIGVTISLNAAGVQTLHTFQSTPYYLNAPLVQGNDGDSYGTTSSGGQDQIGTVFKITATGEMVTLHSFKRGLTSPGVDGGFPGTGLTLGSDGNFYGTTVSGGANGKGTIFRITPQGSLTTIYHFGTDRSDNSPTLLVEGNDGYLYGTANNGISGDPGIAFKVSHEGAHTTLHTFNVYGSPSPLVKAADGNIYGSTNSFSNGILFRVNPAGGIMGLVAFPAGHNHGGGLVELNPGEFYGTTAGYGGPAGIIYRITTSGAYTILHEFTSGVDVLKSESLVLGSDGNLYGACPTGGSGAGPSSYGGIVFRITPSGVFDIVHNFTGGPDGERPRCGLVRTSAQTFRGITLSGGLFGHGTVFDVSAQGTFTTIVNLSRSNDGAGGSGAMVEVEDGSFYGATPTGGLFDRGTIFRMTPEGELTTLYNFQGTADGGFPGRLILGGDGFLYGVANAAGGNGRSMFKVSRTGQLTTLRGSDSEGYFSGDLVLGNDGNFYGTVAPNITSDLRAIAKITAAGELTVIHDLVPATDGAGFDSTLTKDSDGFLYGVTSTGGANGKGTIFKCSPAGDFTVLHHFSSGAEGWGPSGDLVLGPDGSIYGPTSAGGANYAGTIFRIAPNGVFTVLHDFLQDGYLGTTLMVASDGNIYGAKADGGEYGHGMIFQVNPNGNFTPHYSFTGGPDGGTPRALIQAANGRLYGSTAEGGGADGLGTLFSLPFPIPAALRNISTRMRVEGGNNVLIGGFIITGDAPKSVAIRGVGPSLAGFGISDALADTTLELRGYDGSFISGNDDWQDNQSQAAELTALGFALPNPKESGIVATLAPGAYTAILAGANQNAGVGLVEIYDTNSAAASQLDNISTRGFVQTGNNVMIGGFILGGTNNTRIIARGMGPSLAQFGLNPVLNDPTLELRDGNGVLLVANDNWQDDAASAAQLTAAGLAPQNTFESAVFVTVPPGPFTAILAGKGGGTGIGLVEIYNLQ